MSRDDQKSKPEIALENRATEGERLFSPSVARNRDAIRDVFLSEMPTTGKILEVGAGTGEHAVHIAKALPDAQWHTGDPDITSRASISAWIRTSGLTNIHGPHTIDVSAVEWAVETQAPFSGLVSINMIHIAPFEAAIGLFSAACRLLEPRGKLFLYGPFSRDGAHTAQSNEAFDASLKSRDERWGVRDIDRDLIPLANKNGLSLETIVEMPANNLSLIFEKQQ